MPNSTQEQEVLIIGDGFIPGAQANSEIDFLLGYNTHMLDDKAIRSEKYGCRFSPDYCGDLDATMPELERIGVTPLILPSVNLEPFEQGQDYTPMLTASFIYAGEYHITKPFATEELALACALWYVLAFHT